MYQNSMLFTSELYAFYIRTLCFLHRNSMLFASELYALHIVTPCFGIFGNMPYNLE